jgi:hypothetical protein
MTGKETSMSHVRSFRGLRYDLSKSGGDPLALCAPAPDARSAPRRAALRERNPWNVAHLEGSPVPTPVADWLGKGVLVREAAPSLYVYRQTFTATVAGVDDRFTRAGLVALLDPSALAGAVPTAAGDVAWTSLPVAVHDVPSDRLEKAVSSATPLLRFLDDDSVEHSLLLVSDPDAVRDAEEALAQVRAVAVDGRIPTEGPSRPVLLVPFDSPGLLLRPVHRICRGVPEGAFGALVGALSERHLVEDFPYLGADAADSLLDTLPDDVLGFCLRAKGSDEMKLVQIRADAGRRRALDTEVLRRELETEFPGADLRALTEGHDAMEALETDPDASFAILSRPVHVRSLLDLAKTGRNWDPALAPLHPRPCEGLVLPPDA